ncbi:glycine--tRNA ligase subunit beta [Castellaniella sp.]|uniref:glycine--tRNA ligase subunit beta n=1 Tax=Castellaniella sp. TaxID=1955812 RepID=UPI0035633284
MTQDTRTLLVELLTEELPPRALEALGKAFADGIRQILGEHDLLETPSTAEAFATPRRLAVRITHVRGQAPDHERSEKLMPAHIGLDAQGQATPALRKKLEAKGLAHVDPASLVRRHDGKHDMLYAEGQVAGSTLAQGLQHALDHTLTHLPIPKVMQYQLADGHTSVKFVRPAHQLLALWGPDTVPVQALGLQAGRTTLGHRFLCAGPLTIASADDWAATLADPGHVIASPAQRRRLIAQQLAEASAAFGATIGSGPDVDDLLDEVCALVEYPTTYAGQFDPAFLEVPSECLILTMRLNQKYFPLFEPDTGALTNRFLIVSNMRLADPTNIIHGNERVVRPRLADAQFFYHADLKIPLAERVADLAHSVYHNQLGSQLERTHRVQAVAGWLAPRLGGSVSLAERAALLAHADLGTQMVGEFPELQGIMGARYAAHDGEPDEVVHALQDQYKIRLDTPVTAQTLTTAVLFMAERAETLVGIWGIGLVPTGERDPYGLRRAALGLISAYEQLVAGGLLPVSQESPVGLSALLQQAAAQFAAGTLAEDTVPAVLDFVLERYRHQLMPTLDRAAIDAVLALRPPVHQIPARIEACMRFQNSPEATALAAADKRIRNLLKKADAVPEHVHPEHLKDPAEQQLAATLERLRPQAQAELQAGHFVANLGLLAQAHDAVTRFFDEVMVMDEDMQLRRNRLALLQALHQLMNQVADLSRLAP